MVRNRAHPILAATAAPLLLALASCTSFSSAPPPAPPSPVAASAVSAPALAPAHDPIDAPSPPLPASSGSDESALAEMDALLSRSRDAADSNHLSEAIRGYVSVIAIYEEAPSAARRAKAEGAAAELAKIGGRLSLEPSNEWMDSAGTQVAALTRGVGKDNALNPSVYLFESFGMGKSPVPDAPIYFEFVKNSGSMVPMVTTDAYGKANTTVARVDAPGTEAVVRAYPLYRARGKAYAFKSVFRDFTYLPPSNVAKVAALETSEYGASENPQVVDTVIAALKPAGLQLSPYNGKLAPDVFARAFGGDAQALADFGAGASYTAFALVEASDIRQTELNGVKYNIFTAMTKVTFRLVRSDGTVVYSLPLDSIKSQGGTREAAVADGYKRARDALGPALQRDLAAIRNALNKE
jgi:hypothetical protein